MIKTKKLFQVYSNSVHESSEIKKELREIEVSGKNWNCDFSQPFSVAFLVPTRRKSCGTTHVRQYIESRVSVENFDTLVEIFSTMVSKFGRFNGFLVPFSSTFPRCHFFPPKIVFPVNFLPFLQISLF